MSKSFLLFVLVCLLRSAAIACDGCSRQQPRILRGLTHGAGPDTSWDYLIVGLAALSVALTLFYSVKWLVRPGEKSAGHIKNLVLTGI
jgi:hypothetical protein